MLRPIPVRPAHTRRATAGAVAVLASLVLTSACSEIIDPASPRNSPLGSAPSALTAAEEGPCASLIDVPANGTYCGVNTRIVPWAPADAFWSGATFQSDPGHGQSHDITITFDAPVAIVEITAYDPTFGGNAMFAYDEHGALVGSADFPGNGVPGVLTTQTRTISGKISQVHLTAAIGDYLNYSMRVKYQGAEITILEAKGPNDGSFLGKIPRGFSDGGGDDVINLLAKVEDRALEPSVTWNVIDFPGDEVATPVPSDIEPGIVSKFTPPAPDRSRWAAPHPYVLSRTSLAYEVRAEAGGHTSDPATVRQDAMDTQRQEYIDLRVPQQMIPVRAALGFSQYYTNGDYATAVINTTFDGKFAQLEANWSPNQFTVNGLYRNPGHNAYHVDPGQSSGTVSASWHQYGCAADLQVYPVHPTTKEQKKAAKEFWDGLAQEARLLGFHVERRDPDPADPNAPSSGIGHVHVELKCR